MPTCFVTMASMDKFISALLNVLLSSLFTCVMSQPNFGNKFCYNNGNYTLNSLYQTNLKLVLSNLAAKSSVSVFYNSTAGDLPDKVFALYNCRGDMSPNQCNDCVKAATGKILEVCPNQKEGIIWYQECMLRYANLFIFGLLDIETLAVQYTLANYSDPLRLELVRNATMERLTMQAAYNSTRGFATGVGVITSSDTLYGLVQCTPDLLGKPCEICLRIALAEMSSQVGTGRVTSMIFMPSCVLHYSLGPFFANSTAPPVTSLPPPAPASVPPQTPPDSRPTIYHIPSPIAGKILFSYIMSFQIEMKTWHYPKF